MKKANFLSSISILFMSIKVSRKCQIIVTLFILFTLNVSCSNTLFPNVYIPLNSLESYAATPVDSVELYVTQVPLRAYKEIGIFYFPPTGKVNNPEQMANNITNAKSFAAQHGANAVIRLDVTDFNVKGVAIRWK